MICIDKLNEAFNFIDRGIEDGVFPCAAVAVGFKDGYKKVKIAGNKRIIPYKEPLHIDSLFDLASLTKVVATNTLLMRMIEKGLISIYDRVCEYLTDFRHDNKENITIFNLVTHTSGLPAYIQFYKKCSDYESSIKFICDTVKLNKIGNVEYSDLNFILLGKILEKIGVDRLDKLCFKYVFEPLGMEHTLFNPTSGDFVPTERYKDRDEIICGVCHDENARFFGGVSGHAGLFSTLNDMMVFADMLLHEGKHKDSVFISYPTFKRMIKDYTTGLGESRGWGWCIKGDTPAGGDIFSEKAFGHTGFTGTSIWVDPIFGVYIVLLTNRVHPTRENDKIIRFRRVFHNLVISSILV
ncbi:serine hydrolase [Thermoanaerobacterium thermosaccharolyticum]|uniref:serine hydrolase domain-containing protein n=1 Tax=Thermoanaerobacterium thermosaccharolyticum TaxID=1517 RepID=UPI003D2D31DC